MQSPSVGSPFARASCLVARGGITTLGLRAMADDLMRTMGETALECESQKLRQADLIGLFSRSAAFDSAGTEAAMCVDAFERYTAPALDWIAWQHYHSVAVGVRGMQRVLVAWVSVLLLLGGVTSVYAARASHVLRGELASLGVGGDSVGQGQGVLRAGAAM